MATVSKKSRGTARVPRTKAGEPLTEDVTEALAREAERGYDLSKAKRQRIGRPALGGGGTSPRVTFRAAPKLYRAVQARARREGRTVSEVARDALEKYVAS